MVRIARARWERGIAVALAVLALGGAAACSGGGSSSSSSGSSGETPVAGGTLRMGMDRPASFDPALASPGSEGDLVVADLLFDGLTTQPAGATTAEPALASSWTPSADAKVWQFTLRSDATFSNGRVINATDVKYSLERVAKQGEGSVGGLRLEPITGWKDFVSGTAPELVGVKAIAPTVVEIDLDTPLASLPSLLSSPTYGVVPREAVEAPAPVFGTAPVGSGPFAYATTAGNVVSLARAAHGSALLSGVELHLYDDPGAAYDDFAAGKLDWSLVPSAKADDAVARFGSSAFGPFHAELFYAFNLLDPTYADARFRQAIVQAINRHAITSAVYPEVAVPLDAVVPDGVPGHVENACGATCAYDPAAAKALLAQAFPNGGIPTVRLDYATGSAADAIAGAIESSLTAVGIPVERRPKDAAAYDEFAASDQRALFQFGWVGLYPDQDPYLVPLFTTGSRDNATGYSNADVDSLLAVSRTNLDPAGRTSQLQQAEAAILAQSPIIPIAQFLTKVVATPAVNDMELNVGGTFAADRVWLTP